MYKKIFNTLLHGGDYNPEQWINYPEIIDEDMRLMKKAGINSATINIFSWGMTEPEEGVYNFGFLDKMMDKLYENGISVILATPSGARPAWLAQKYPEVLRVEPNGIRNEYGIRHNHCLTSPVYREKVRNINTKLAERYKDHPALKMWHISNEYCGECHCEKCQNAFREWLKKEYHNDLQELNDRWWNSFWSHQITDWEQISSPKDRGEPLVTGLKLAWKRFVSDSHISFFENEILPLRELTPNIPVTTNLMNIYDGIDYQKFAKHLDIVSWDNYPGWDKGNNEYEYLKTAFIHDIYRSLKDGQSFLMMESTPSLVNWHDVNRLPLPGRQTLSGIQAIAHGSDSVQYFQWRKSRGSHEKFHGAVVDHCGHENTRVFKEVTETGTVLKKLSSVVGMKTDAKVAIIYDWENGWAVNSFCGYNNNRRDYADECIRWYAPFNKNGIAVDVISQEDDFSKYSLIISPFMYMLKDGVIEKTENYVKNGGNFVSTYLTGIVNKDDLCFLGGFPAEQLKDVFGIWAEETDSLPEDIKGEVIYNAKKYTVDHICDIIHTVTAETLAVYNKEFYKDMPSLTKNTYGKGTAYYCAFRNDNDFYYDLCIDLIKELNIKADSEISAPDCVEIRRRGDCLFILNFSDSEQEIKLGKRYSDIINNRPVEEKISLPVCGYTVLKKI